MDIKILDIVKNSSKKVFNIKIGVCFGGKKGVFQKEIDVNQDDFDFKNIFNGDLFYRLYQPTLEFPFMRKEFIDYLCNSVKLDSKTAKAYANNYLPSILNLPPCKIDQIDPDPAKVFLLLPHFYAYYNSINDPKKKALCVKKAIQFIGKSLKCVLASEKNTKIKKRYQNWLTALNHYQTFLESTYDPIWTTGVIPISDKLNLAIAGPFEYNYDELFNKFKLRLSTQDRYPNGGVSFPAKVISRDDKFKNVWNSWANDCINNIKIYTAEKKDFFTLSDLNNTDRVLQITKAGNVKLKINGNTYTVTNDNICNEPMTNVFRLRYISIEHNPQIADVLKGLTNNYKWKALYKNKISYTNTSENDMKEDLEHIKNECTLSLLERRQNKKVGHK